jgi:hypothetical protein
MAECTCRICFTTPLAPAKNNSPPIQLLVVSDDHYEPQSTIAMASTIGARREQAGLPRQTAEAAHDARLSGYAYAAAH